ncbi:MAG TPA: PEGA domain-containing protein, partial [Minicystis sp.]|nr:PEGA domain-containing protein [Minicystis sp.]
FARARRRARRALTAACAAAAATLLPGAVRAEPAPGRIGGAPPTEPEIAHAPDPAKRDEARAHFEKGLKLLQEEAWQASLAEFLRSRELYPTRAATINAGVVLRKLHRFDEALDMFESVLRDFSGLTAAEKQSAQTAVAELRQLVGTIDVTGAVPGATIVVDGKNRADYPIVEPLRVAAGTHVVRVFKVGFEPFEKRAEVAGGQTLHIDAQLVPLRASGRLRIAESSGKKLDVHVDGALVGVTPWDGVMAVGTHAVVLQGDEDWGTPPVSAKVKVGESTVLNLPATHLESQLAVTVAPAGAEIVVDAVPVGHGAWQGRLARGSHRVEARADGFFPRAESFSLDRGELKKLSLTLERDAEAAAWRKPAKAQLDAVLAFGVAPSLGGGVAGSCSGECNGAAAIGGLATLHATYRFGSGFGVGLAAGYLRMTEDLSNRAATIQATGLPASHGKADDALRVHGALVGATAGYALDLASRVPAVVRVGAGALIGSVRDARTGTFPTRAGADVKLPEASSDPSTAMLYVDPEAQVGFRVNDHLQLFADVQALFLVAVKAPRWGDDANPPLVLGADGFAKYPTDTLVGTLVVVLAPGVGARWTF